MSKVERKNDNLQTLSHK